MGAPSLYKKVYTFIKPLCLRYFLGLDWAFDAITEVNVNAAFVICDHRRSERRCNLGEVGCTYRRRD